MSKRVSKAIGADLYLVEDNTVLRSASAILVAELWRTSFRRAPLWGFLGKTHQGCSPVSRVMM